MKSAHRRTAAIDQARIQIEELLAQPYDSINSGNAVADRVTMDWTITDRSRTKEIVFVYQYTIRSQTWVDTISAALSRP